MMKLTWRTKSDEMQLANDKLGDAVKKLEKFNEALVDVSKELERKVREYEEPEEQEG